MHKILFICHGNICRSPMAEFLLKDIVNKRGIAADFEIVLLPAPAGPSIATAIDIIFILSNSLRY